MKSEKTKADNKAGKTESTGIYVKTGLWKEVLTSTVISVFVIGVIVNATPYSAGLMI